MRSDSSDSSQPAVSISQTMAPKRASFGRLRWVNHTQSVAGQNTARTTRSRTVWSSSPTASEQATMKAATASTRTRKNISHPGRATRPFLPDPLFVCPVASLHLHFCFRPLHTTTKWCSSCRTQGGSGAELSECRGELVRGLENAAAEVVHVG